MKMYIALSLALVLPSLCYAEDLIDVKTFRCGDNYAYIGDTQAALIEKCGQPTNKTPTKGWVYEKITKTGRKGESKFLKR